VEFEWDEAKSERNRTQRGLPFNLATELFNRRVFEETDTRRAYGEKRVRAIGRVGGATLVCIYTDRADRRRIISLRYASRRERDAYRALYPD
jgi:hypothetical protein